MKRGIVLFACLALVSLAVGAQGQVAKQGNDVLSKKRSSAPADGAVAGKSKYVPVMTYDPARNAEQDIKEAAVEAKRTGKRVLVEVGGDWCVWCHLMDEFFDKHPDVLALREKNFIMVKVNFSEENKNAEALSHYPKVAGYPHIFILDKKGALVHSQDTGQLEEGRGYNIEKFKTFLTHWATASSDVSETPAK